MCLAFGPVEGYNSQLMYFTYAYSFSNGFWGYPQT